MRTFDNTATIIGEAQVNALTRSAYIDDSPPDPDAPARAELDHLARVAPSAGTAAGLLAVAGVRPVPLDRDSLEPIGEPCMGLADVADHWRTRPLDGAGVRAGVQSNGSTVFAVRGTLAALRAWLADVGAEDRSLINEYGTVTHSSRSYRPTTPFTTVRWSPPAVRGGTVVAFGAQLIGGTKGQRSDRADEEASLATTAWLAWTAAAVWTVAPAEGVPGEGLRHLQVRSRKLGGGVEVVGQGDVIPWHVRGSNGWTCSSQGMPIASDEELSPWLVDAVGATWKAVR